MSRALADFLEPTRQQARLQSRMLTPEDYTCPLCRDELCVKCSDHGGVTCMCGCDPCAQCYQSAADCTCWCRRCGGQLGTATRGAEAAYCTGCQAMARADIEIRDDR